MSTSASFSSSVTAIAVILATMGVVAAIEIVIPLHARGRWHRDHLAPNLALTLLTFGTNVFLNVALLALVVFLETKRFGLLGLLSDAPLAAAFLGIAALDLAFYAAHVSWHSIPALWRFHAVHHSDPAVDVTTTIRQHPVESLMRYAAMAAMVVVVGPSAAAFAVYRVASAVNGLLEHANIRAPRWLDRLLSLVTSWPHMHKVHHSRRPAQTDTNFGNLFSVWDRLFGTFTPSWQGTQIHYGLDGLDVPRVQSTRGLLALPFRGLAPGDHGEPHSARPGVVGATASPDVLIKSVVSVSDNCS